MAIMTHTQVEQFSREMKEKGFVVVLVTGVFDGLHSEHRIFLDKAKKAGDVLLVGVERDERVKALKGESRPFVGQDERVAAIESVSELADAVFLLPTEFSKPQDYVSFIEKLRPDVLAVSSHSPHLDKKRAILEQFGGRVVVVHEHNPAVSTTILNAK